MVLGQLTFFGGARGGADAHSNITQQGEEDDNQLILVDAVMEAGNDGFQGGGAGNGVETLFQVPAGEINQTMRGERATQDNSGGNTGWE